MLTENKCKTFILDIDDEHFYIKDVKYCRAAAKALRQSAGQPNDSGLQILLALYSTAKTVRQTAEWPNDSDTRQMPCTFIVSCLIPESVYPRIGSTSVTSHCQPHIS